jgi:hypothetical protein
MLDRGKVTPSGGKLIPVKLSPSRVNYINLVNKLLCWFRRFVMSRFFACSFGLFAPAVLAHSGHGGVGLFHHFPQFMPLLLLLVCLCGGYLWLKRRH